MEIAVYTPDYRAECLSIFDSNSPTYFTVDERKDFEYWLDHEIQNHNVYWIGKDQGQLVACAGIYLADEHFGREEFPNEVGFAWGMVHSQLHNQGYGQEFATFRINYLKSTYPDRPIILRTTQKTYHFFERLGFKVIKFELDGYGPELDKITMKYEGQ